MNMRHAAALLTLLVALFVLISVHGCGGKNCDGALPAACPAPQSFAQDASIPAGLGAECFGCLDGGAKEYCDLQGSSFYCHCVPTCN